MTKNLLISILKKEIKRLKEIPKMFKEDEYVIEQMLLEKEEKQRNALTNQVRGISSTSSVNIFGNRHE